MFFVSQSFASTFQFHKGSIDTNAQGAEIDNQTNFNSIKVRLILIEIILKVLIYALFQFHKGSIDTYVF